MTTADLKRIDDPYRAIPMPELAMEKRLADFAEVATGYTREMAVAEASRCRQCRGNDATCILDCPLHVDVPAMTGRIAAGDFGGAAAAVLAVNPFPSICGRLCPAERLCRSRCAAGLDGEAIEIGHLERFAGDLCGPEAGMTALGEPTENAPRVAVVGAGPSGLSCAAALAQKAIRVTVFEAMHRAGGSLAWHVPAFRLPPFVLDREIERICRPGLPIRFNAVAGRLFSLRDLLEREGFAAVYLASGGGGPRLPRIPGRRLHGVLSGAEYLARAATGAPAGNRVVVVGGGDEALDCARTALRMGARAVTVLYRRSAAQMPARRIEVDRARQEGVRLLFLTDAASVIGEEEGSLVRGVECLGMELTGQDACGRPAPRPDGAPPYRIEADLVAFAIGRSGDTLPARDLPGLERSGNGRLKADPWTRRTSVPGLYAGGEAAGPSCISEAMRDGRQAAQEIGVRLL